MTVSIEQTKTRKTQTIFLCKQWIEECPDEQKYEKKKTTHQLVLCGGTARITYRVTSRRFARAFTHTRTHVPQDRTEKNNNNENGTTKNVVQPNRDAIRERWTLNTEVNTENTHTANNDLALARFVCDANGKCCRMAAVVWTIWTRALDTTECYICAIDVDSGENAKANHLLFRACMHGTCRTAVTPFCLIAQCSLTKFSNWKTFYCASFFFLQFTSVLSLCSPLWTTRPFSFSHSSL